MVTLRFAGACSVFVAEDDVAAATDEVADADGDVVEDMVVVVGGKKRMVASDRSTTPSIGRQYCWKFCYF